MKHLAILFFTLVAFTLSPLSQSNEKTLIVGSEQNYPPFALGMNDQTADGFTVELWRAVAKEEHFKFKIRVLPFHQILNEFKAEKIDILINLAQSPERRQFADFTVPHVVVNGAIFIRNGNTRIHAETDLSTQQIIVLKADLAHDYAIAKGWQKQLVLVENSEQGFKLLATGQYDALLLSKLTGQQTLEKLKLKNIEMLPIKIGFEQKFSFAVHKGNAHLLEHLNEGLALVKTKGIYDKLYEKWFGIYEEKTFRPLLIKYLVPMIAVFLLILSIGFYLRSLEHKHAIRALREKELRYRSLVNNIPDYVMRYDRQYRHVFANELAIKNLSKTVNYMGKTHREMGLPKYLCEMWENVIERCFVTQTPQVEVVEWQGTTTNMTLEWRVIPEYNSLGELETVLAISRDITERKQAELALLRSNMDLTRFAEISAHHLMEPTRRINSYTQRLRKLLANTSSKLAQEIQSSLDYLQADAHRLHGMIHDIQLYLAAAEPRGIMQLEDANVVLNQVQKRFQIKLSQSNTVLVIEKLPPAWLDRARLLDLFSLILDNALVHGHPTEPTVTPQIIISGERVGNLSRYQISDNGAGILPEYQERVFGIFERLTHNQMGGSGIGLAIVRRIVESRHGHCWIVLNKKTDALVPLSGTSVIFELPDGEL
jgi:PAS domain S-box-containing protein